MTEHLLHTVLLRSEMMEPTQNTPSPPKETQKDRKELVLQPTNMRGPEAAHDAPSSFFLFLKDATELLQQRNL